MADNIMACKKCNKDYDAEDHIPYISKCGHNICKRCMAELAPFPCPICKIGHFNRRCHPNYIALVLLQQAENDRTLIHELLDNLEELRYAPIKPERATSPERGPSTVQSELLDLPIVSTVDTAPTASPPVLSDLREQLSPPMAPAIAEPPPADWYSPSLDSPPPLDLFERPPFPSPTVEAASSERRIPSLGSPPRIRRWENVTDLAEQSPVHSTVEEAPPAQHISSLGSPPRNRRRTVPAKVEPSISGGPLAPPVPSTLGTATPKRQIPSLGSPPRNRRPVIPSEGESSCGTSSQPSDNLTNMVANPYVGWYNDDWEENIGGENKAVTVENPNPDWAIPDINEHFGQLGVILNHFPQRDANNKLERIDLLYDDIEIAKTVIFSMNGTPNECGGKLKVHFKNWIKKKTVKKVRPFEPTRTIWVGYGKEEIAEDDLKEIFSRFGRVIACRKNLNQHGKQTGFALVEFHAPHCVQMAIVNMHLTIPGRNSKLTVKKFTPKNLK